MLAIANIVLMYANAVSTYSITAAQKILGLAKAIATLSHGELATVIDDRKIKHKFISKKNKPENAKGSYYDGGTIYFKGHPIPIQITPNQDLTSAQVEQGERFKSYMNSSIVKDAFNKEGTGMSMTDKLLMAVVGLLATNLFALIYLLG